MALPTRRLNEHRGIDVDRTDEAMGKLSEAMREQCGAGDDFEMELGRLVGRYRGKHERDMRDMQIAQLIPHGVENVCERFGGKKRMNQYRAARGRELLKLMQRSST